MRDKKSADFRIPGFRSQIVSEQPFEIGNWKSEMRPEFTDNAEIVPIRPPIRVRSFSID
jgi:hypothetical protein